MSSASMIDPSQENVNNKSNINRSNVQVPPKPPRSAFMCFTDSMRKKILSQGDVKEKDILKMVSVEWRKLSEKDKAFWDEEARNDKVRFVKEKAEYKGPWIVPKRRARKNPLAPKRPMSAFLKYSQKRRASVKENNPDMSNTDISRLLGEMWRNASQTEKAPYVEQEERERAVYKEEIRKWRESQARVDAASRTSHHSVQKMADDSQLGGMTVKPAASPTVGVAYENFDHSSSASPYEPIRLHNGQEEFGATEIDNRIFRPYGHRQTMHGYDDLRRPVYRPYTEPLYHVYSAYPTQENTAAKKDYPEADRFEKPNNAQEPPPKREDAQTYVVRSPYFSSGNDPQGYSGYYFGRRHPHA